MSISRDNKSIKIPGSHYIGFAKRGADDVPLGFMTVDGADAAARKRKKTVDDWAASSSIPAQRFENKPLTGFKLGRSVRHGGHYGQGSVRWRIEDPRGFELEISSPNFASILTCTTIENGEILDQCVWGRLGGDNVLLPVSSDVYQAAVQNTVREAQKASLRGLKPGDGVVMRNGVEGRFLGYFYPVTLADRQFVTTNKKHFVVGIGEHGDYTSFEGVASPKLAEIVPGEPIDPVATEKLINDLIQQEIASLRMGHVGSYGCQFRVSLTEHLKTRRELKQYSCLVEAEQDAGQGYWRTIIGNCREFWGIYGQDWHSGNAFLDMIDGEALKQRLTVKRIESDWSIKATPTHRLFLRPTDNVTYYALVTHFETEAGSSGSAVLRS